MRRLLMQALALLRPRRAEDDLAREIDAHLAQLEREHEKHGMSPAQARLAARRAFGGVEQAKTRHREARSLPGLENILFDMRLALRTVFRSPGFSIVTVLLIALGVAATTTLFSLTYGVLLRPLPWRDPDRVVRLQETRGGRAGRVPWTITNTTYHAWRDAPTTVEAIGGWFRARQVEVVIAGSTPERLRVANVTAGLFPAVDVPPIIGRAFSDEDASSGTGVAVLAHHTWQRRFGGRADVVGSTLTVENRVVTILGVMPAQFAIPDRETDAWMPFTVPRVAPDATSFSVVIFNTVARLRPGVTPAQAAAEATSRGRAAPALGSAGLALFGSNDDVTITAVPARDALTADVKPALLMLLAAVGLLFVTAVASVLVLQSSRAVRRRRDMAVRAAIGASAGRLTLLWLLEGGVLGATGGTAGITLALALHRALPAILPPDFPRVDDVVLDVRVAFFAAGLTLLATLLFGLVPAWQSRDRNLHASLSADAVAGSASGARREGWYLRSGMIVTQVAVACMLLVASGLLVRTFAVLLAADRGFDPRNVVMAYATQPWQAFATSEGRLERTQERLRALPGVTDVAIANALPFVTTGGMRGLELPSPENPAVRMRIQTMLRVVSPEYFSAMRLRMVAGRPFDRSDTAASRPVVIVNQTFASRYLPPRPVGSHLRTALGSRDTWEVVGVVDDMRQGGLHDVAPLPFGGAADPPQAELFFAHRQWETNVNEIFYVVRSAGNPGSVAPLLRAIVSEENPSLTIESVATMEDLVLNSLARPRTYALLVSAFALFATAVALVGLFGVLSHIAAQRTREIGVRAALGAAPLDIVALVTREAFSIALCGAIVGLAAAFLLANSLSAMTFGISTHDLPTFIAVPAALILATALACALPAYRASRTNPMVALRQ